MKMLCNKKGITLLELIIAVGLVAIIAGAAYTVLLTGVRTFNRNIESTNTQSGLRAAMMKISKLEHKASANWTSDRLTLTVNGADHVIKVLRNVPQADGTKVDVLQDNGTTIALNISTITMTPGSKAALGANRMLTVTLTGDNGATLNTQFYID